MLQITDLVGSSTLVATTGLCPLDLDNIRTNPFSSLRQNPAKAANFCAAQAAMEKGNRWAERLRAATAPARAGVTRALGQGAKPLARLQWATPTIASQDALGWAPYYVLSAAAYAGGWVGSFMGQAAGQHGRAFGATIAAPLLTLIVFSSRTLAPLLDLAITGLAIGAGMACGLGQYFFNRIVASRHPMCLTHVPGRLHAALVYSVSHADAVGVWRNVLGHLQLDAWRPCTKSEKNQLSDMLFAVRRHPHNDSGAWLSAVCAQANLLVAAPRDLSFSDARGRLVAHGVGRWEREGEQSAACLRWCNIVVKGQSLQLGLSVFTSGLPQEAGIWATDEAFKQVYPQALNQQPHVERALIAAIIELRRRFTDKYADANPQCRLRVTAVLRQKGTLHVHMNDQTGRFSVVGWDGKIQEPGLGHYTRLEEPAGGGYAVLLSQQPGETLSNTDVAGRLVRNGRKIRWENCDGVERLAAQLGEAASCKNRRLAKDSGVGVLVVDLLAA